VWASELTSGSWPPPSISAAAGAPVSASETLVPAAARRPFYLHDSQTLLKFKQINKNFIACLLHFIFASTSL